MSLDSLLQYGLVAVFVALMLTPFGLPIPEDVSLTAAGVLSATGHATWVEAWIVGYLGVVGSDIVSWTFGRRVGLHPTGFIARMIGPEDIERIERFYRRWGPWAIVIARQFPGMRMPAFFFAGASGISLPRFLLFDGTAALITTTVFTWLGWAFADDLGRVLGWLDQFSRVGSVVGAVLLGLIGWRVGRRFIERRRSAATSGPTDPPATPPAGHG